MERNGEKSKTKKIPSEDDVTDRECADMLLDAGFDWTDDDRSVKEIAVHYNLLTASTRKNMAKVATNNYPCKIVW